MNRKTRNSHEKNNNATIMAKILPLLGAPVDQSAFRSIPVHGFLKDFLK